MLPIDSFSLINNPFISPGFPLSPFLILKFIFLIKLLWVQWEGYFAEYVEYLWINVI